MKLIALGVNIGNLNRGPPALEPMKARCARINGSLQRDGVDLRVATTPPRARSSRPSSPERPEASGTDTLGLRLADGQGAEARADQRTGRDLAHLTDVSGRFPTSSLPRRGGRLLRVEKERRTQEDAVLHPTPVRTTLRLRGYLVHEAWREGNSPGHLRHRYLPAERAHGEDSQPHAGEPVAVVVVGPCRAVGQRSSLGRV